MTDVDYPLLLPQIPVVWRDTATLQIGLDPFHARAVPAGLREHRALTSLDGTRSLVRVLDDHEATGGDRTWLRAVIAELANAGAVLDGCRVRRDSVSAPELARLAPDLAAWSQARPGTAESTLHRRRAARVSVRGTGRVGVGIASLLVAAGVGDVRVTPMLGDFPTVPPSAVGPLGPRASSVGSSARVAARDALASVAFGPRRSRERSTGTADIIVLCPPRVIAAETAITLSGARRPHLVAVSDGPSARVGPLVVPGQTPCLTCLDLHRTDRDPSWPLVAAQVTGHRGAQRPAVDSVLATLAASVAALHVLAMLDFPNGPPPSSAGALLELRLPSLDWTRRSWGVHPDCGCQWSPEPIAA